jgi:hypothetical protein
MATGETENVNEEQVQPFGILFGVLAYNNNQEFEAYIDRLNKKSLNDTLLTIHSALRYAQNKGVYSIEETEAISITLRKIHEILVPEEKTKE